MIYRGNRKPFLTAYLNGHRTDVTIPGMYYLVPSEEWNSQGRTFGHFTYIDGMLHATGYHVGYTTSRGRLELLSFIPNAIDDRGRVAGVKQPPHDPRMSDPTDPKMEPVGMIWENGIEQKVGRADSLWFGADGSLQGLYLPSF
jgi:hypothetical protein